MSYCKIDLHSVHRNFYMIGLHNFYMYPFHGTKSIYFNISTIFSCTLFHAKISVDHFHSYVVNNSLQNRSTAKDLTSDILASFN